MANIELQAHSPITNELGQTFVYIFIYLSANHN